MPNLEIYVCYNKTNGRVDVIRGRRAAERVTRMYNKLFSLLYSKEMVLCLKADEFFNTHHVDKENIHFSWLIEPTEKMLLYRKFFYIGKKYVETNAI